MIRILSFLMLLSSPICAQLKMSAVEKKLFELEGVIFEKMDCPEGFKEAYHLMVKQPIDHTDVSKGYFYQHVFLSHRNVDSTTVLVTEGYERNINRIYELTDLLKANQVQIEHRFYGRSVPENKDYTYLTIEQATADYHHINILLRSIYADKWVSTGISKGGQTTIFYRYFYPNDVEVSIPYVAPLNTGIEDNRIYDFLDHVGTKECRDKIEKVQIRLLQNSDAVMDKLKWYSKGANLTYNYLNMKQAYEYAVLEYSFSFWQWGGKCEDIPSEKVSVDSLLHYFIDVSGISFFADESMKQYASHYYQSGTQLGYYGYDISKFKPYLKALSQRENPLATFMPNKMPIKFDGRLTNEVKKWVSEHGDRFIYIYGANDTWTATGVPINKERDALWYIIPGKDHGGARIKNLPAESVEEILNKIKTWQTK
jgi:hypothetical protein